MTGDLGQGVTPHERYADAFLVEWTRDGETWVEAFANEVSALDRAKQWRGTCTPLYRDTSEQGYAEAVALATTLHRVHYGPITTWRPLDTVAGVLSQIDNLTAGLIRLNERPDRFANDDAAKALYETWSDEPGYVPWTERGNSQMQEKARREVTL